MMRRHRRLAWAAATAAYLLIILGAVVRITGSGLGCGDHWPLCNGHFLPPLDLPTWIEWSHRLVAALVSILVVALAVETWLRRRPHGVGSGEWDPP
ncbi:MAG TPA: COX15/CtaA family protein, partial [Gemmatimonadales bacterium]